MVNCSGRGSRSDRWLGSLGLEPPAQVEVKAGVSYSTRFYRRRPGDLGPWQAALVLPAGPHEWRSAVALPVYRVATGVQHLVDPPSVLFRPGFAAGVLRQARNGKRASPVRR